MSQVARAKNRNYLWTLSVLALAACGGGEGGSSLLETGARSAGQGAGIAVAAADISVQPNFHRLPVDVEPPTDDEDGSEASAYTAAQQLSIPGFLAQVSTLRQTDDDLANLPVSAFANNAPPVAATVYTPAQIRAAYGMPAIPTGKLSAEQAAALGAGQTIYIVDAFDNPNAVKDLATFNARFGLPTCTESPIAATTALPLKAAPTTGCTISVVYASTKGLTTTKPAYQASWAGEIALDVQWAHVQAPMARIVLIEAASAQLPAMVDAVNLANKMGGGVVSMSFGAPEGSWMSAYGTVFNTPNMTYVASAGDSGYAMNWPAVAPAVLAVGGTSLVYTGGASRKEYAWKLTGGGLSAQVALPAWQKGVKIIGQSTRTPFRGANDVAFVADPGTGMYVVGTPPGGSPAWRVYGGTSAGAPQWAGIMAVINAQRVYAGKALMGDPHDKLYTRIAAVPGIYVGAFADVTIGNNGTQAGAVTATGYDLPTGLGTPNFGTLSAQLKSF
jgi:subtilase family serine protease